MIGNYFGGWKSRYFNLDPSSGTVFYADANQSEILGSFSLLYAYAIPQSKGNPDTSIEKPGFIVLEYKKAFFSGPLPESRNIDGLPTGKIEVRHVLFAETLQDRDEWVRCVSGVIAKFRPTDCIAQDLFEKTEKSQIGSGEPLHTPCPSSSGPSDKVAAAKMWQHILNNGSLQHLKTASSPEIPNPEPLHTSCPSSSGPSDKVAAAKKWQHIQNNGSLQHLKTASSPGTPNPSDNLISNYSNSLATQRPSLENNPGVEQLDSGSSQNINRLRTVEMLSPAGLATFNQAIRPKSRHIDDQTRCLQQTLSPISLVDEVDLPVKLSNDKKKSGKGRFKDWMKRAEILKLATKASVSTKLFGTTIQEAAALTGIKDDIPIPAIVYRCIEYLDAMKGKRSIVLN
jgi:hypothetical protein